MNWLFIPEQVIDGDVSYSLQDFQRDLMDEVRSDIESFAGKEMATEYIVKNYYKLIYDICFWGATNRTPEDVCLICEQVYERDNPLRQHLTGSEFIQELYDKNRENIDMLRAIFVSLVLRLRPYRC